VTHIKRGQREREQKNKKGRGKIGTGEKAGGIHCSLQEEGKLYGFDRRQKGRNPRERTKGKKKKRRRFH